METKKETKRVEVSINMNTQIKVVLTPYGEEAFRAYYKKLKIEYMTPEIPEDKKIVIGMWEISNIFGDCLYMGNNKVPFKDNSVTMCIKVNKDRNEVTNCVL